MPRPVHLAGQRLRRRPDKCDAGCRPSGRRIPRPAARSGRTRSLCRSSSSRRNRFAGFRREPCWGGDKTSGLHFFGASMWGGGITTLGVRFVPLKRWTRRGLGGVFVVFMPSRNLPRAGRISPRRATHATPAPNRAHSGSQDETRGVFTA